MAKIQNLIASATILASILIAGCTDRFSEAASGNSKKMEVVSTSTNHSKWSRGKTDNGETSDEIIDNALAHGGAMSSAMPVEVTTSTENRGGINVTTSTTSEMVPVFDKPKHFGDPGFTGN